MPGIENWLTCPLPIIQRLFVEWPELHEQKLKEYFFPRIQAALESKQIPSLNDSAMHDLPTNSIVHYRAMIQDMHDPEFYLSVYEVENVKTGQRQRHSGRYRDLAECGTNEEIKMESDKNVMGERLTYYCVPIPGESSWVKQMYCNQNGHVDRDSQPSASNPPESSKRPREEDDSVTASDNDVYMESENVPAADENGATDSNKKSKMANTNEGTTPSVFDLNLPLPGHSGPTCYVKVYSCEESFKLNDMVEIVGVLSNDPAMASFASNNEKSSFADPESEMMDVLAEDDSNTAPPSLVPRLHALTIRKLSHSNPLLPSSVDTQQVSTILADVESSRRHLVSVFTDLMFGDELVAEYLLCHLVSSVYTRHDVIALGQYTLNITGLPRVGLLPKLLHGVIKELVSKCHLFHMSLENLNKTRFIPTKDYKANRLQSGILQLSERTHLILDETSMQPGQLDTNGVANLTALGNVVSWQKVDYDFRFHRQEFHTNIITLILSEGKSILKSDCQIPLVAINPGGIPQDLENYFQKILSDKMSSIEMMDKVRTYIGLVQLLPYDLPADLQKEIEEDFVETRKVNTSNMSVEDFHGLLILARLLALTHGQSSLSKDVWNRAKVLEIQRKTRLVLTSNEQLNN